MKCVAIKIRLVVSMLGDLEIEKIKTPVDDNHFVCVRTANFIFIRCLVLLHEISIE